MDPERPTCDKSKVSVVVIEPQLVAPVKAQVVEEPAIDPVKLETPTPLTSNPSGKNVQSHSKRGQDAADVASVCTDSW